MQAFWDFVLAYFAPILGTVIGLAAIVVWASVLKGFEWLMDTFERVMDRLDDLF